MSITALRLRNFRGFREATVQLKPLTVLLGPNSAGKSSFGQALAAMAHAHRIYGSGPQASLTPPVVDVEKWPVDLGKTNDLRTTGANGPVRIGLETRGGWIELGFGGLPHTSDLLMSYVDHPSGERSATARTSPMQTIMTSPPDARSELEKASKPQALPQVSSNIEIQRINENQWQEGKTEVSVIVLGLIVKAIQHVSGTPRILSGAASDDLKSLLENLVYLRANRKRPLRGYQQDLGPQQLIGYSGEWTPSILHKEKLKEVTYREPPSIPISVDKAGAVEAEWRPKRESLSAAINSWLSRLRLASGAETVPPSVADASVKLRVKLDGQEPHDITEIGFGVSQVIPVLVAGLLQPEDSLFIVDLPEAHLHPRPQGAIADFFCSLALSGRYALVETHSEMFFHQLRLRAAMTPRLLENIAVYFIDQPKDGACSHPRPVGLGQGDDFDWPEGFLQEGWETETQINTVREATERRGS